ncbi:MAG: response regulator [Candidatus Dormibacteria bacterium]
MDPVGRILVAEDEASVATPVISHLSGRGHDVRWVRAVREMRAEITDYSPDVLVLDVTLDTDGLEFFQAIRFAPECPPGGVVVLTEEGNVPMRERASQLGAAAVLPKPLDAAEVTTVIEDLLALI